MRARLRRGGTLQLIEYESSNPRGYYRATDPRPGSTADDPPRYKKHSHRQLVSRGYVPHVAEAFADEAHSVLSAEFRDVWKHAPQYAVKTRHTYLGRMREYKLTDWIAGVKRMQDELAAAGFSDDEADELIGRWAQMDIEIDVDPSGGVTIYDEGDQQLRQTAEQEQRAAEVALFAAGKQAREIAWEIEQKIRGAGLSDRDFGVNLAAIERASYEQPAEALAEVHDLWSTLDQDIGAALTSDLPF